MPSRRSVLSTTSTAGALALAGCTLFDSRDPSLSGEWLQAGFDSSNRNYGANVVLPDGLTESWRTTIGRSWLTSPLVVDGTVIVGSTRGISAFAASDGTEQWQQSLDGDVVGNLAISGGSVLVPEHRREDSDRFHALDVTTGEKQWAVSLESRPFSPSVRDGWAYLRTETKCLAISDGEIRWQTSLDRLTYPEYNVDDDETFTSTTMPAVLSEQVVVPDHDQVVALDAANGSEQWRVDLHGTNTSPVVVDDLILAIGVDDVLAVGADGSERWRTADGGWYTLAATDGEAYVLGANSLKRLDLDDGTLDWEEHAPGDTQRIQPAIVGDAVLVASSAGIAYLREDPGLLGDRELFQLDIHGPQGVSVGAGKVFVHEAGTRDLVALGPDG